MIIIMANYDWFESNGMAEMTVLLVCILLLHVHLKYALMPEFS